MEIDKWNLLNQDEIHFWGCFQSEGENKIDLLVTIQGQRSVTEAADT